MASSSDIVNILSACRTIAVVGLSNRSDRPSYGVAQYMQKRGYRIIPVNPSYVGTEILGEHCYATLHEAAAALASDGVRIDLIDCFRRSELIEPIAEEAVAIGARCLWMQLGVVNEKAAAVARAADMQVVMDRCIKIDHASFAHQLPEQKR